MGTYFENITVPSDHIQNVFGQYDKNINNIGKAYHVAFVLRNDTLKVMGEESAVKRACSVVNQIIKLSENGTDITDQNVNYAMGYCELKQCYLTPSNVSEKQCLLKGKVGFGCKYFCLLQGNQCKYGVKKFKQKKWGGKNDKQS